ncbi:MAG: hypothetical protein V7784_07865, partial [Oceanospirillaceae bacterium]
IYSSTTAREKFRLLNKIWSSLSEETSALLTNAILKGPKKREYEKQLSESEWQGISERKIWLNLSKLNAFGRNVPHKAQIVLDEISNRHPEWKLETGERDEFSTWSETTVGSNSDLSAEELFNLNIPDLLIKLKNNDGRLKSDYMEVFGKGAKEHVDKVLKILKHMNDEKINNSKIWHEAIYSLSEIERDISEEFIALIINNKSDLLQDEKEHWVIAWWLKKNCLKVSSSKKSEAIFWKLSSLLLKNIKTTETTYNNIISSAINSPEGILADALILRLGEFKLKIGQKIPNNEDLSFLNELINPENNNLLLSRVVLFSRLQYFYAIDPDWTTENMVPQLQSDVNSSYLWQGYLRNPRIDADLAFCLKNVLLNKIKERAPLGKSDKHLMQIFTIICLEYPSLYSKEEIESVFSILDISRLEYISSFLQNIFKDSDEKEQYWLNRIKPYIESYWPQSYKLKSQNISTSFSLIVIGLKESFEEAVEFISSYLSEINLIHRVAYNIARSNLCTEKPKCILKLLSYIFIDEIKHQASELRSILDIIESVDALLKKDPTYIKINECLILKEC